MLDEIIEILKKRPEKREKADIMKMLPIVKNINLFNNDIEEEKDLKIKK